MPLSRPPRVAVSVVTFHSDERALRATIQGLLDQDEAPWQTRVLVNDARSDEVASVRAAVSDLPGVAVEKSSVNLGFAGGHNRQLAQLFGDGADSVLVLNPDLRLAPGAVARLWQVAEDRGPRCLVGPLLELGDERLVGSGTLDSAGIRWTASGRHLDALQGRPLTAAPTEQRRVPGLTGACILVPHAAYRAVVDVCGEFFDEDFVAYREDAELGLRCQALGIDCWLEPAARGVHRRGVRGTSRSTSAHVRRLGVQNRFLILFKHGRRRPGNPVLSGARDVTVLLAAGLVERTSWAGVSRAWSLRSKMRQKRRALEAHRG